MAKRSTFEAAPVKPVEELITKPYAFYKWLQSQDPDKPVRLDKTGFSNPVVDWLESRLQPDFDLFTVSENWITWKYRDGKAYAVETPSWLADLIIMYYNTRPQKWNVGILLTLMLWFGMAPLQEYINPGRRC